MADFPSYERDELDQRGRDLIRLRRRGADVSEGSDFDITARLLGALAWGMQQQGKVARGLLDPRSAFGDYLAQYVLEAGIGRDLTETSTGPVKATGKVIIRSSTASQTQAAGTKLRHADGTEYTLDASVTTPASATKVLRSGHQSGRRRLYQGHVGGGFVSAAAGEVYLSAPGELCALEDVENGVALKRWLFALYNELDQAPAMHTLFTQQLGVVASITAVAGGRAGNKDPKDVLTVVSPTGTIIAEASILALSGGQDAMQPSTAQGALRGLYGGRPALGTLADIRALALAHPGTDLAECYVAPATHGLGTYTLLPVHEDGQYLGANQLASLLSWVSARLSPVDKLYGASVYEQLDSELTSINVAVADIYATDWVLPDQGEIGLEVEGTPSVSSITVSDDSDVAVGDRILVRQASAAGVYICQRRVSSVAGRVLGLETPLPFPPAVGAIVTPGGPLGDAIIDALYAAYAARAPGVGSSGIGVRKPISTVSSAPDAILASVSDVPGVLDAAYRPGTAPTLAQPGGVLVPSCVIRMYTEV